MDTQAVLERLERDEIEHLWITYHDYSGVACAKTVGKERFRSGVEKGIVFALANLDMDILDHQAPDATLLAGEGDFMAVPDPRSYVVLPQFPRTARMHAWMRATDGSPWDGCPRTRLEAMIDGLAQAGHSVRAGFEPEFYLLTRDENGECRPTNRTRMFTQDGLAAEDALVQQLAGYLHQIGIAVDQLGKEYGAGQYEMTLRHADPLKAVDDYLTLRQVVRETAREFGYLTTFMPKPYADWAGCSLHVHLSLWDAQGRTDVTPSNDDERSLSRQGMWFMGGLIKHAHALTGLGAPTVNSYKRLLPGSWAPAHTYWGYGNRSALIRIPGVGPRRHLEFRSGDNTCQPFMFMTALLGAGLDGVRNEIDPGPDFAGDAGHLTAGEMEEAGLNWLPRTLPEALAALESDAVIRQAVGETALDHFLKVKRSELSQYNLHVHPWERDTYLEIV